MEVTRRTAMDRKGGHLARLKNGRLCLREAAQCDPRDAGAFADTARHAFFNTNNLWISLDAAAEVIRDKGYLSTPLVVNRKRLVLDDPRSPEVFHLESALGSALSLFEKQRRSPGAPVTFCAGKEL